MSFYIILNKFELLKNIDNFDSPFGIVTPYMVLVYLLGLAYVFGFLTQELFNITPFTSSNPKAKFSRFVRWVYKKSTSHTAREEYSLDDIENAKSLIYKESDTIGINNKTRYERFASLKQIGTAVGSGFCVSSAILFISSMICPITWEYFIISIALLLSGVTLIVLGWVKLVEQTEFASRYLENSHPSTLDTSNTQHKDKIVPQQERNR